MLIIFQISAKKTPTIPPMVIYLCWKINQHYMNFELRDRKAAKTSIIAVIWHKGKRIKLSTGQKVEPRYWNPKKQRAKAKQDKPENSALNRYLEKYEAIIKLAIRELTDAQKPINAASLKAYMNTDAETGVFDFFDQYIQRKQSKYGTENTKKLKTAMNWLRGYRANLTFQEIDSHFWDDFIMYLQNTGGLAKNTIGTHLKKIKQMLKEAHQAGLHSNTSYQAFQTMQEQVDAIYLTMDEIEAIYNLTDLPAYLERSRDRFLIGCYTGLRYADFSQIIPSNIDAEGYLRVRTRKTKALVVLPVHPNIYAILQRNGNQPPRSISNQKLNQHLKEIARLAEITQPVSTVRTEGGKRVERTRPKWQLVSTHTARRSFATNAYLAGIPVPAIMQITGHATYKSFLKYVRVDAERNARLLKDHSFFSQHGK